jgi:hypothetical protein
MTKRQRQRIKRKEQSNNQPFSLPLVRLLAMLTVALLFIGIISKAGYAGEREAKKLKSGKLVSERSPIANSLSTLT